MSNYPHTTFSTIITNPDGSTAGVEIPDPQFTDEEKAVIQLALDGESLFNNPVEGLIATAKAVVETARFHLNSLNAIGDNNTNDYFGNMNAEIAACEGLEASLDEFKRHTARISGASGGEYYDTPDGDLYGFNALQGIASAFNGAKDAMRSEDDPVEDNYSIHFSSILDSGTTLLRDIINHFGGDGTRINGYIITPPEQANIPETGEEGPISGYGLDIGALISRDNLVLEKSIIFLEKYSRGNMVLGMNKDVAFGKVLLDSLETETLKAALDAVSTV